MLIARYRRVRGSGQAGWALMDAIWSSVVVVMAFMGTFLAIDASTKTATTDVRKTTAYDVAQNEIDRLRKMGDVNLPNLLAQNNTNQPPNGPSRYVTIGGVTYSIWNQAYYVQDIGTDVTDACGNTAAVAGNTSAQYVYIKTTVSWPGLTGGGATSISGTATSPPAMLDTYFAPEGGDLQTNTATLRVYLHDRDDNILSGRTVHLYKMPLGSLIATKTTSVTGCVLFTGIARGDYEIRTPTTNEYDLYMTTNPATIALKITSRAAISRTIRISQPVTVTPAFNTDPTGSAPETVTPGASTSVLAGPWIATAPEFIDSAGTEYMPNIGFMPHASASITNKMFPLKNGYSAYAGSCDISDPGTGNYVVMPAPASNPTWAPNYTYTGTLSLRLPNLRVRLSSTNPQANSGKILVRLKNKVGGGASTANCGTRTAHYNTWVPLPGYVDNTSGYLPNPAYALPTGQYDICARQTGTNWSQRYMYVTAVDNTYPGPITRSLNIRGSGVSSEPNCPSGSSSLWTG